MDQDTFSPDDFIGKVGSLVVVPLFYLSISFPQASIKLSKVDKKGGETSLDLVSPSDGETHLSDAQTTAIYNLFSAFDPGNFGRIDPEYKKLVDDYFIPDKKGGNAAVLLNELKTYVDDKQDLDGNGEVSFGEFLEQFRVHEDPGDAEDINMLAEDLKIIIKAFEEGKKNKGDV